MQKESTRFYCDECRKELKGRPHPFKVSANDIDLRPQGGRTSLSGEWCSLKCFLASLQKRWDGK